MSLNKKKPQKQTILRKLDTYQYFIISYLYVCMFLRPCLHIYMVILHAASVLRRLILNWQSFKLSNPTNKELIDKQIVENAKS